MNFFVPYLRIMDPAASVALKLHPWHPICFHIVNKALRDRGIGLNFLPDHGKLAIIFCLYKGLDPFPQFLKFIGQEVHMHRMQHVPNTKPDLAMRVCFHKRIYLGLVAISHDPGGPDCRACVPDPT